VECNKSVCKQVICDAHDKRFTKKQEKHMFYLPKSDTSDVMHMTRGSQKSKRNICSICQNQTLQFGKLEHPV
jgi:hypothetical protein